MVSSIQKLFDFIAAAERSRKYPPNTATNNRSPLRLIESELNEEERDSIESIKKNLEQIFHAVYLKNQSKMSASSIEVYKRRVKSLIADYESYGSDPSKMASWNRDITTRKSSRNSKVADLKDQLSVPAQVLEASPLMSESSSKMTKFELQLRSDAKAVIFTPSDLNSGDMKKIQGYVDYLKTLVNDISISAVEENSGR